MRAVIHQFVQFNAVGHIGLAMLDRAGNGQLRQPAGTLVHWDGLGWVAVPPVAGQMAWIADEGGAVIFDGSWRAGWPVARLLVGARTLFAVPTATVAPPAGGTVVDAESRAALANLIAALQAQGVLA